MKKYYCLLVICLCHLFLGAQRLSESTSDLHIDGRVATIQLSHISHSDKTPVRLPIIQLGSGEQVQIDFDILGKNSTTTLEYQLLHYGADLKPSADLSQMRAFRSFNKDIITFGDNSFGTKVNYTHYKLTLPNDMIDFEVSGIFMLTIRRLGSNAPLFSLPIYVYEDKADISLSLQSPFESRKGQEYQSLKVDLQGTKHLDLLSLRSMRLCLVQNESPLMTNVVQTQAVSTGWNRITYEWDNAPTFWAGSPYKRIEHYTREYLGDGIRDFTREGKLDVIIAQPSLAEDGYFSHDTQRPGGIEIVQTKDQQDSSTQADYQLVEFRLYSKELKEGDVYLDGAAFDYLPSASKKFSYNHETGAYTIRIPLKEGYQEYKYVFVPKDKANALNTYPIEAHQYSTHNGYICMLFGREIGDWYDRLLGVGRLNNYN